MQRDRDRCWRRRTGRDCPSGNCRWRCRWEFAAGVASQNRCRRYRSRPRRPRLRDRRAFAGDDFADGHGVREAVGDFREASAVKAHRIERPDQTGIFQVGARPGIARASSWPRSCRARRWRALEPCTLRGRVAGAFQERNIDADNVAVGAVHRPQGREVVRANRLFCSMNGNSKISQFCPQLLLDEPVMKASL